MDLDDDELRATRIMNGASKGIEIGEYVKDIYSRIGKIQRYSNGTYFTEKFGASTGEIVKHSKNIKDMLKTGDIIKTNNLCGEITKIEGNTIYLANYMGTCNSVDIKSILTKEQYNANCFVLKE